jgi:flagellar basal-body rod protein FlgG
MEISDDGTVWAMMNESERQQLGQLQVATFINNGGLKAMGKNIFLATDASGTANISAPNQSPAGSIMQRYLESSNVDVVREMTDMISTQRAFEMNSKVIQTVDQMLQNTTGLR